MRQYWFVVVAVVAMVLVASCAPKAKVVNPVSGTEEGGKAVAALPAAASPAAPAPAPAPAASAKSAPKLDAFHLGDQRATKTTNIAHETKEFKAETPTIYVDLDMSGLAKGQKVKAAMQAVDVKAASGQESRDVEIASAQLDAMGGTSRFALALPAPNKVWPVGKYHLLVTVDGKVFKTDDVTVK